MLYGAKRRRFDRLLTPGKYMLLFLEMVWLGARIYWGSLIVFGVAALAVSVAVLAYPARRGVRFVLAGAACVGVMLLGLSLDGMLALQVSRLARSPAVFVATPRHGSRIVFMAPDTTVLVVDGRTRTYVAPVAAAYVPRSGVRILLASGLPVDRVQRESLVRMAGLGR